MLFATIAYSCFVASLLDEGEHGREHVTSGLWREKKVEGLDGYMGRMALLWAATKTARGWYPRITRCGNCPNGESGAAISGGGQAVTY